jgi:hypothetical protein
MRTMIGEGKKKIWTGGGGDGIFSPIFISIILSPMYFFSTLIIPGLISWLCQPSLSPAAGLLLPLHAAPISLSRSSLASAFAPFALSLSRAPFCAVPLAPLPELVHSRLRVHRRSDRGFLLQLSAHLPPLLDFLPPCRAPASPPWSTPLHPAPAPRAHHSLGFFFPLLPTAPLSCLLCSPRALLPASFLLGAHLPELTPAPVASFPAPARRVTRSLPPSLSLSLCVSLDCSHVWPESLTLISAPSSCPRRHASCVSLLSTRRGL